MTSQFLGVKELAAYLNVSTSWVYKNSGKVGLVHYEFGSGVNVKWRFKRSEVDSWIRNQRVSPD
ncbi:helix-turn-helix domain-containing protein [Streptomyces sp. NPDC001443]